MQNILERNNLSEQSNRVKYRHLAIENNNLQLTVKELQTQIESLRAINSELMAKSPQSIQILIDSLSQQNHRLQTSLFRLVKNNEELSCDVLMKNQLICEADREFREIIANFEEKIYELRVSIQNKEITVSTIEEKGSEEKEEAYGMANRVNLMYFNEMNELKAMLDRLSIENSQLAFINTMKEEEIEKLKALIEKYEGMLGAQEAWKKSKETVMREHSNEQTRAKKAQAKNKLEEELTRYDMKYKYLSTSKGSSTPNLISNLKFMVTQLNKHNRDLSAENAKLLKCLKVKDKEYRIIQEAYQKLSTQLSINRIEVQFYKQNFKELNRVPTERKIRFFDEHYEEIMPNLERRLRERNNIINYWKHWLNVNDEVLSKRILSNTDPLRKRAKRSSSCCFRYSYQREVSRRICHEKQKEDAVFSFINETHNVDSMINFTIDEKQNGGKSEKIFNDDISVIVRANPGPVKQPDSWKKKKAEMTE